MGKIYCDDCLRKLKPNEVEDGICALCKEERAEKRNLKKNKTEYNYLTDHNEKDSWDNSAPYSEEYTDQYNW